jgi:hypothetical protein
MALKKTINLPSGVSGEYIKITHVELLKGATIRLLVAAQLHKDATFSDAPAIAALVRKEFVITKEQSAAPLMALGYTLLKTLPNLLGAEDV